MKRVFSVLLLCAAALNAQETAVELPLKRLSLFSSGVGYFEHVGTVTGNVKIKLSFARAALNDALKSLVVNDVESGSPRVSYLSDAAIQRTLQSLRIDLSGDPGLPEILRSLKGSEIIVRLEGGGEARGRITAVDAPAGAPFAVEAPKTLSLAGANGVRTVDLRKITGFSFTDSAVQGDLSRALDLIASSHAARSRDLTVELTGKRKREVTLTYVIPVPVWKISYRLDLGRASPLLQSWAIIDNDGDVDWNNVEVSLVSGRPVSFVQALYPPYYTNRPTLPLAGAGFAEAQTFDSGYGEVREEAQREYSGAATNDSLSQTNSYAKRAPGPAVAFGAVPEAPVSPQARSPLAGGLGSAQTRQAGENFEFTLKRPVRLSRRQSAMLPLFDGVISARKVLVFSGLRAQGLNSMYPAVGAELSNTSGLKLPAGSITVFDGGTYAGDALMDFFGTDEKRIISYGEDITVSGSVKVGTERKIDTVKVSKGYAVITRKSRKTTAYTIRNSESRDKRLLIEHPFTQGAALIKPEKFSEQTSNLYRFEAELRGGEVFAFEVEEESPVQERVALLNLPQVTLLGYADNKEVPENVRAAFREAVRLRSVTDGELKTLTDLENERKFRISEQERTRANLQAAGASTGEGKNYLSKLTELDKQIAESSANIDAARRRADAARTAFEAYLNGLEF